MEIISTTNGVGTNLIKPVEESDAKTDVKATNQAESVTISPEGIEKAKNVEEIVLPSVPPVIPPNNNPKPDIPNPSQEPGEIEKARTNQKAIDIYESIQNNF